MTCEIPPPADPLHLPIGRDWFQSHDVHVLQPLRGVDSCMGQQTRKSGARAVVREWSRFVHFISLGAQHFGRREHIAQMDISGYFPDEIWLLVASCDDATGTPGFVVFDNLIPRDDTELIRRFAFPPKYGNRILRIRVDHDRRLGRVNRNGPLTVDPPWQS